MIAIAQIVFVNASFMNCLPDTSSWCAWLCAEALCTLEDFKHDYQLLNKKFLEVIKPIYEDFSRDELLIRCVWVQILKIVRKFERDLVFCIKYLHAGLKIIKIVPGNVCIFNEEYVLKIISWAWKRTEIFALQQDRRHRMERRPSFKTDQQAASDDWLLKNFLRKKIHFMQLE